MARPLLADRHRPLRRRTRRGRRRRDAHAGASTRPRPWSSTTTRCRRSSTPRRRWRDERRCCSPTPAPTSRFALPFRAGDDFFDGCEVVVEQRIVNQRRRAVPDRVARRGRALGATTAGSRSRRAARAPTRRSDVARMLGLERDQVRVIRPTSAAASAPSPAPTPRSCCSAWLARRLGRPVRWVETRTENMLALGHGRGQVQSRRSAARATARSIALPPRRAAGRRRLPARSARSCRA